MYLLDRVQKGENISRMEAAALKAWIDRGENSKAVCFCNGGRSPGPKAQYIKIRDLMINIISN